MRPSGREGEAGAVKSWACCQGCALIPIPGRAPFPPLAREGGRSAAKVAAELGIRAPLLYRWAHLEREPNASKSDSKPGRSVAELEAEIRRLRAENAKLLEQREVLKKSLGILSEVPPRGMPESNK